MPRHLGKTFSFSFSEEETQAILVMADQLDAAHLRIEELEEDLRLWKEEAYRWRHVQTGE